MFAELVIVCVLDLGLYAQPGGLEVLGRRKETYFVKVIFVELTDEGSEIGVLEHAGEDGLCKLVHVLDDKAVAMRSPRDDVGKRGVLEHPK